MIKFLNNIRSAENLISTNYELMKLDLQEFFDREEIMSDEEESFYDYFTSKYK
jgi:hypothetical protein